MRSCPHARLSCASHTFIVCVCSQGRLQDGWPEGQGPQGAVRSSWCRDLVVHLHNTPTRVRHAPVSCFSGHDTRHAVFAVGLCLRCAHVCERFRSLLPLI